MVVSGAGPGAPQRPLQTRIRNLSTVPGFEEVEPMVLAGLYPVDADQ